MRENPFLFESEESENESQFEDSSEFFENEYEGEDEYETYEAEGEYDETEYDETEFDETEFDETEYDETEFEDEYEEEFRGGRSFRTPARTPRSFNRFRQPGARRVRPQARARARTHFQSRSQPPRSQSRPPRPWRPRYPGHPGYRYPYYLPYSPRPIITGYPEPAPSSSETVRLLQNLLNKTLGLNLPVDGVMNVETRSAIRSFQNQPGSDAPPAPEPSQDSAPPPAEEPAPAEELEFEFAYPGSNYGEFEDEYYEQEMFEGETSKTASAPRYVRGFASPDAECADAFKLAKKTRAQALTIINTQIGRAIRMLRFAANNLKHGSRSAATRALFKRIFRVTPEFVPTWMKPTASIKDRGDVVATRCRRVADMLESGGLRYFCTLSRKNCPDCSDPSSTNNPFACSSWGKHRVVCLHTPFWDAMGRGDIPNVLAVLMHEPFHIFYGRYVTEHSRMVKGSPVSVGKFGGIYCILQFVFEINKATYPARIKKACDNTQVRI